MAFAFLVLLLVLPGCIGVDLVLQPGSLGPDVVNTVVNIIRANCILPEDKLFLRRLAYIETRDGSLPKTYGNPNFDGGIWQVTRDQLLVTQRNQPALQPLYKIIQDSLHINWRKVTWKDLRKPLYSGLAAALYLNLQTTGNNPIPLKIEEQAAYWEHYYHTSGSAYNFTELVEELQLGCHASKRQVDLVFIVDTSSSLSTDDFKRIQNFLQNTLQGFNVGRSTTHVAVITYSSLVTVQFPLDRYFTNAEVSNAIGHLHYVSGATNTAGAINAAVLNVFDPSKGGRQNAVKVAVLITDGRSDDFINTQHGAELAAAHGISLFTVGVGHKIDASELKTISTPPSCVHAFAASGFDSIANLKQEIQSSVCRAPLYANETVTCQIDKCPPYAFPFTGNNGVTVQGSISCGKASLYADINNYYPSTSHNLFILPLDQTHQAHYQVKPDPNAKFLYVSIEDHQGTASGCNITLTPLVGDKTNKGVEVICREMPSGHERLCEKPDLIQFRPLICDGSPGVSNPCTATDASKNEKYPYPGDNTRYIQCLPNGFYQVAFCPPGNIYDTVCKVCYGSSAPKVDCTTPFNLTNPCTAQNLLNKKFYFEYPGDHHRYLQCDIWGKAWVRECKPGDLWVQEHITCETPGTSYNPCKQMYVHGESFYAYPPDPHKYIQCVDPLNPQIQTCRGMVWDDCDKTCVPASWGICGLGSSIQGTPGTFPQVSYPSVTHHVTYFPGAIGAEFSYPCTRPHLENNQLYFPVSGNKHQYIQCALTGLGYIKDCQPNYFWNPNSFTCVPGPLTIMG